MDRITIVTGASSGIGAALAPRLASQGEAVALFARRTEVIEALANDLRAAGHRALAVSCDVTEPESVREAVARTERELGPVGRLVANAGIGGVTPGTAFSAATFERIHRTNVLGTVYCIEAVLPGMLARRKGHLVGISSLASYRGLPRSAAYCSSKAALNSLLESLRIDLGPKGIAVTTICPGYIRTPLTASNVHPMPYLVELDDAAELIMRSIQRQDRIFAFPWQLASQVRAARIVPAGLWDRIARRLGGPG